MILAFRSHTKVRGALFLLYVAYFMIDKNSSLSHISDSAYGLSLFVFLGFKAFKNLGVSHKSIGMFSKGFLF